MSRKMSEPGGGTRVSALMRHCRRMDVDRRADSADSKTAKVLAPEDVRAGDFVALLQVVEEIPSYCWFGGISTSRPDEPVRVPFVPKNGGVPLRVRSVCLPFILVKAPSGKQRNLDVRLSRLARLDRAHARAAWKACKKRHRNRKHA
jgi:hypothetical protein